MSRDLQLKIVLGAVDKATQVIKKIRQGNKSLADTLKKTRDEKSKLDTQFSNLKSYRTLQAQLRANARTLKESTASVAENTAAMEKQQAAHTNIKAALTTARNQHKKLTEALLDGTGKGEAFQRELEKARITLLSNQQAYEKSAKSLSTYRDKIRHGETDIKKLTATQKRHQEQLAPLTKKLNDAGINLSKTGKSARELRSATQQLTASIEKQKSALAKINSQLEKRKQLEASLKKMHGAGMSVALHGAGAAYVGKAGLDKTANAITPGIDFEARLRDMKITGGFSKNAESQLGKQIRLDAEKYGQFTEQIADGLAVLVANGITKAKDLNYYSAVLAKSSVATNSDMEDLGNLIISLRKNLNVAVGDIPASLDSLAYAGKEGSFEIKDMAKWLPQLSPMMAALGVEGRNAVSELGAALQIARLGAGNSDEAANNLKNYLAKITAPETIKHFDDAGIDLKKRLLELSAKGVSPVQGSLEVISEYMKTKGLGALKEFNAAMNIKNDIQREAAMQRLSEAYALGDLFRDMQAMSFIRPAIANRDQMAAINRGAQTATGMIDADWKERMETSRKHLDELKISVDELKQTAADILLPELKKQLPDLIKFVRKLGEWMKANPELAASIAKWSVVLLGAVAILGVLGFALGNAMIAVSGFAKVALALGGPLKMVGSAIVWLGRLFLMNPIGLAITAIALGAYMIYKHWEPIKAWFKGLWAEVKSAFDLGILGVTKLLLDWSPFGLIYKGIVWSLEKLGISVPDKFKTLGSAMVDGLLGGIHSGIGRLKEGILSLGDSTITWFKDRLGIRSPSRVFAQMGRDTLLGFEDGLDDQTRATINRLTRITSALTAAGTGVLLTPGLASATPAGAAGMPLADPASAVRFETRAPLKRSSSSQQFGGDTIYITVQASPGMNEQAIAQHIQRALEERDRKKAQRRRSALFDND